MAFGQTVLYMLWSQNINCISTIFFDNSSSTIEFSAIFGDCASSAFQPIGRKVIIEFAVEFLVFACHNVLL